jgi:Cu2+-containing amine oxidase
MKHVMLTAVILGGLALVLCDNPVRPQEQSPLPQIEPNPLLGKVKFLDAQEKELLVYFPLGSSAKEARTAWKITWDLHKEDMKDAEIEAIKKVDPKRVERGKEKGHLFREFFSIKKAEFNPEASIKDRWIQVLGTAHVSEFYVPYHDGKTQWYDVRDHGLYSQLSPKEAGQRGRLLKGKKVIAELRDRGIVYRHDATRDFYALDKTRIIWRRGEEVVLWASLNAHNYDYLVQFGFQDDGTIALRTSATGMNFQYGSDPKNVKFPFMSHLHNACWRVDVCLGPEGNNAENLVYVVEHNEAAKKKHATRPSLEEFNDGFEGRANWEPKKFTRLQIENPNLKIAGNRYHVSYDLIPLRHGTAYHDRKGEEFTQADFWVTRSDSGVKYYLDLPAYFTKQEKVNGRYKDRALGKSNVTIWHMTSVLHDPRSEDGLPQNEGKKVWGQATTVWNGFDLRPRDLFTGTPFYPEPPANSK